MAEEHNIYSNDLFTLLRYACSMKQSLKYIRFCFVFFFVNRIVASHLSERAFSHIDAKIRILRNSMV